LGPTKSVGCLASLAGRQKAVAMAKGGAVKPRKAPASQAGEAADAPRAKRQCSGACTCSGCGGVSCQVTRVKSIGEPLSPSCPLAETLNPLRTPKRPCVCVLYVCVCVCVRVCGWVEGQSHSKRSQSLRVVASTPSKCGEIGWRMSRLEMALRRSSIPAR